MFFKGSRYQIVATVEFTDRTGRAIRYKRARLIPETGATESHLLIAGERLDHLAYRYYRDPERYWRICDANRAVWPGDLVAEPGRRILIPSAEG
jgi:hypothetical protein